MVDIELQRLIIGADYLNNKGLLYGKMGLVLTLYQISRKKNLQVLYDFADSLVKNIIESITKFDNYDFAYGLCGIGWSLEYLIHNRFVEGDSLSICECLDESIMKINPNRLDHSLEHGIKGFLHYVLAHIYNCNNQRGITPFDEVFLHEVKCACKTVSANTKDFELTNLCSCFLNFASEEKITYCYDINSFILEPDKEEIIENDLSLRTGLSGKILLNIL